MSIMTIQTDRKPNEKDYCEKYSNPYRVSSLSHCPITFQAFCNTRCPYFKVK